MKVATLGGSGRTGTAPARRLAMSNEAIAGPRDPARADGAAKGTPRARALVSQEGSNGA